MVRGVGGADKEEVGRKGKSASLSQASPRARTSSSRASPSRRGGVISRKPADWHLVKKHKIKPDQSVRQFPALGKGGGDGGLERLRQLAGYEQIFLRKQTNQQPEMVQYKPH